MSSKENMALRIIDDVFVSRPALISFLNDRLNLKVPQHTKKEAAIKYIIERNMEQKFCQTIFKDIGFTIKVGNFEEAYEIYKLGFLFTFFTMKELAQMAEELSSGQTKWRFRRRPRRLLLQSILKNATTKEIEDYIQKRIRNKEIPRIQANKSGWILGPLGLLRSTVTRASYMMKDMTKFLLKHIDYPSPFLEFKERSRGRLDLPISKRDPLLKEKICQLLLAKLTDEDIFEIFNQLIAKGSIRIESIERYWNFVATPFGIFQPPYSGEANLAKLILGTFRKEELRPKTKGTGAVEDLIQQECILEPPDKILVEFFGSGPYLAKIARKIGLVGLHRIENEQIFIRTILLKLGFEVPPELRNIISLSPDLQKYLKEVKDGAKLAEGIWNAIYSFLERVLEDLVLFYGSVWHQKKLAKIEEDVWEAETKDWIGKTFKLKKQFDYLTFGDLCALVRNMNEFSNTNRKIRGIMSKTFKRNHIMKVEHLRELDFIKGCRTGLTKIHRGRGKRECEQRAVLERLASLLNAWITQRNLSRTYPYAIRLKGEVRNEFGVSYYSVVDEEGRVLKLKTDKLITPENVWFMISRNDAFPIDPVLVKKYW